MIELFLKVRSLNICGRNLNDDKIVGLLKEIMCICIKYGPKVQKCNENNNKY